MRKILGRALMAVATVAAAIAVPGASAAGSRLIVHSARFTEVQRVDS